MKGLLIRAVLAVALLAPSVQAQVITGYNITNTRLSGFGQWSHTYSGTMTAVGGGLYNYTGGGGTLNDGSFAVDHNNNHLFQTGDNSVITLFLDNVYSLSGFNIFGGNAPGNSIPGTLTGATIGFGASFANIASTPFSTSGTCGSGPCDDAFSFASTALATETGNQITISNVQSGFYFSIAEVDARGVAVVATPEPASFVLLATGLGVIAGIRRRNRKGLRNA